MGIALILALAVALAFVPALVDRWAVRRGASSQTLAALAAVTLVAIAAVPVAFTICTGTLALDEGNHDDLSLLSAAGLLLVALAAGRATARMLHIRRRWATLSRIATTLGAREEAGGVKVLPVGELLAFVSGTDAFVSQGLIDRLTLAQRRAVIEHEREHAMRGHGRLIAAARAVSHGAFGLAPARDAAGALDRELDAVADVAAATRSGGARAVGQALSRVAAATSADGRIDPGTEARIERLARNSARPLVDGVVRIVTLALGALLLASICLSVHAVAVWLGVAACVLLVTGFVWFTKPLLGPNRSVPTSAHSEEVPHV